MPSVGLEPTISAGERPQIYALDRAATGTGNAPPTPVINKRIFVELLAIREESVMLYLWGMNPLANVAYFLC
jgi:hypothetical protein